MPALKITPRPAPGLRSWQQINQRAAARPLSGVARRKRLVRGLSLGSTLLMAAALSVLVGWAYRIYRHDPARLGLADADATLRVVDFQSDGVLTPDWARTRLGLQNGTPLLQLNVFALRHALLADGQVSEAFVERALPDTLQIRVVERHPLLRVAAANGAGGYRTLYVAADGTVYDGQLYSNNLQRRLPWLAGLKLHRAAGGIAPINGMDVVAQLLNEARNNVPQFAAQWTVVDLSAFDPRPPAPLSLIKVRTRNLGEVSFLARDFHRQLDRLVLIAQDLQEKQLSPRQVDLSFDNQAVVQLAALPPFAENSRRSAYR
jgi:cell division septal protein FtsQ